MSNFNPGVPTGTVNLDVDYQNLQNNNQQLDTSFGVGHTAFSVNSSSTPAGYHKAIQMIPQSAPAFITNFGQLYSQTVNDGINTDQELWWITGNNRNIQLTRNFVPTIATKGSTFLPGGLIMQWGTISGTPQADTAVNFTGSGGVGILNYPNNNFGVWTNMQRSGTNNVDTVYAFTFVTTGFSYRNTSSAIKTFNWFSIGN